MSAASFKHLDPTQVELDIEVSGDELERARERAFRELARNVKMPGFRPGKVPRRIFESQYGTSQIEERALNAVVPQMYSQAMQDNALDPVDQPRMEVLPEEEGRPLRVRATVAVRPQFEPHDYTGITLHGSPSTVSDEDVDNAIDELRTNAAVLVPIERPVAFGDVPTIDFEGKVEGEPFEGGQAEGQATEIAEDRFIPGFAAGIVGMSAGETKDIEAHFPGDYANTALAGKSAIFTVTVHENKVAEPPELDDEFAKRFGDSEATLGTLRDAVRNRLEADVRTAARRELTQQLLAALSDAHDFPLPAVMVERETDSIVAEARAYVERSGHSWDDYLRRQDKSDDVVRTESRIEAERRVKTSLLIEAIAKAENISATSADIEAEVQQLSERYRRPPQAILEMLRANWNALTDGIVRTKTVEFLLEKANVTDGALPAGGAPASAAAAADGFDGGDSPGDLAAGEPRATDPSRT